MRDRGLVTIEDEVVVPTPAGQAEADQLLEAQREVLLELIAGWGGADDPDVEGLVDDIARRLAAEDQPAELLASDH